MRKSQRRALNPSSFTPLRRARIEMMEARLHLTSVPAGFSETVLADTLGSVTAMDLLPDGRVLVATQGGDLEVVKNGALLPTPFVHLAVDSNGERGLIGVVHDPDFANNHFVYLYHTVPAAGGVAPFNEITRYTANGDVALAGSELDILRLNDLSSATNHNGGSMHFGADGMLYVGVGENANPLNSQTLGNLLGKVLRIDVSQSQPGDPVNDAAKLVPADNPFVGTATGINAAIYALGFRNPFTFAVQPGTGTIFINDVGQNTWEEIDPLVGGDNYGWNLSEGFANPNPPHGIGPGTYHDPLLSYNHSGGPAGGGVAIIGGVFYNPSAGAANPFPATYTGKYFYADLGRNWIRDFDPSTPGSLTTPDTSSAFATSTTSNIVDMALAPDGGLYYLARGRNGSLLEISYTNSSLPTITGQPADQTVTTGTSATFNVTASGAGTLSYQWQRDNGPGGAFADINGANSSSYTFNNPKLSDDGSQFRVVVSIGNNSTTSNAATLGVTSNQAPAPSINIAAGLRNGKFDAGKAIQFSLSATDAEDGVEPAGRFSYKVQYITSLNSTPGGVVRPFVADTAGKAAASFTPAATGPYTLTDVLYRITFTVTDTGGLQTTVVRDIQPNTSTITLITNPPGLNLNVDGQSLAAPTSFASVVGFHRLLDAPVTATSGGKSYAFASWSDAGAASHSIVTPTSDAQFTATYKTAPASVFIDAGGPAAGSFKADFGFIGGKVSTVTAPITTAGVTNPAPQAVYDSERYGTFSYVISGLTIGHTYTIRLHFAENWWGVKGRKGAGQRLQDVTINSVKVLGRFDIFKAAGGANRAVVKTFTTKADSGGKITLKFQGSAGSPDSNAKLSGLEILP